MEITHRRTRDLLLADSVSLSPVLLEVLNSAGVQLEELVTLLLVSRGDLVVLPGTPAGDRLLTALPLARALIGKRRLLLLDEPTNGLDPNGILDMRKLIGSLPEREGVTMFVSSHILAEVEHTATYVGLMHKGRLLLQSPAAALRARQTKIVRLKVDRAADVIAMLRTIGIEATRQDEDRVLVTPASSEAATRDIAAINSMLVERGIRVSGLEVLEPSLEEIFIRSLSGESKVSAAPQPLALAA